MTAAPLSSDARRYALPGAGSFASRARAIRIFHVSAVASVFAFILILIAGVFS